MNNVPVFLVTGFLEGGKTSFIKEIFNDPQFSQGEKILLISCEEGIEELEDDFLKKNNIEIYQIDEKEEFTSEMLKECDEKFKPGKVIIEYNGTWEFDVMARTRPPKHWVKAQTITPIDADTYEDYMGNMKSMMIEQFKSADLIIFNRCNDDTNKLKFRNSIKAVNPRANIIFELKNGQIDNRPLELPFDINADVIEFSEYDYGVWYVDLMESPEKYEGKKIKVKGITAKNDRYPADVFAFGRPAMTCCADDIQFLGALCKTTRNYNVEDKCWIEIEGTIHIQLIEQYNQVVPYIIVEKLRKTDKPKDEIVYF